MLIVSEFFTSTERILSVKLHADITVLYITALQQSMIFDILQPPIERVFLPSYCCRSLQERESNQNPSTAHIHVQYILKFFGEVGDKKVVSLSHSSKSQIS